MKILQVGTLGSPLKPDMTYGGIQRDIIYLDERYMKLGHESQVVTPNGSIIKGKVLPSLKRPLVEMMEEDKKFTSVYETINANLAHFAKTLEYIKKEKPDIIHDHTGKLFPFGNLIESPLLTTLHGPEELFWDSSFYDDQLSKANFCAISKFQQKSYHPTNVEHMVYNGIPVDQFPFSDKKEDYMFMLALMWEEKGPHLAIELSKKTGIPLILAGKVRDDPSKMGGRGYFESKIKPHIDGEKIKFVGELTDEEKKPLFEKARFYLHPGSYDEPFGLVLIEAMACGTPVIASNKGAIPEVIEHGKTGFVINSLEEAIESIPKLKDINPLDCRKRVEEKFSDVLMAKKYLKIYEKLIESHSNS